MNQPTIRDSLLSGLAGAAALTLIHQTARAVTPVAPRMDVLGRNVVRRTLRKAGLHAPRGRNLQLLTLAGDLVANTLYYALVDAGRAPHVWRRGTNLGSAAGLGALVLPPLMGLGRRAQSRTRRTSAMTFAWYLAGGLAAAGAASLLNRRND